MKPIFRIDYINNQISTIAYSIDGKNTKLNALELLCQIKSECTKNLSKYVSPNLYLKEDWIDDEDISLFANRLEL